MKEARHKGHILHGSIYVNCWGQANLQKQKVDERWSRAGAGRMGIYWGWWKCSKIDQCDGFRRCKKQRLDPWVGKIRWRRAWQPTPVFLPGRSHGQRGLVGYMVHGVTWSQTRLTGQLSTYGCRTLSMYRKLRHTSHGWTGTALELNFNKSVKKKSMVPRAYLSQTL